MANSMENGDNSAYASSQGSTIGSEIATPGMEQVAEELLDKEIKRNLNVGRSLNVSKNADIRGNVTIGHDLRVKGWLRADNLITTEKGMFSTVDKLSEVYPNPKDGWWAIAGENYLIYLAEEGEWKCTGDTYEFPSIEFEELTNSVDEVNSLSKATARRVDELSEQVETNGVNIQNLNFAVNELNREIKEAQNGQPVACTDEDDLLAKAMNADYPVGQQFYIPEE